MPITITLQNRAVTAALNRLNRKLHDLTPAMQDIGEALSENTKRRFVASRGPDGQLWKPNAESTLLALLRKKGNLSKRKTQTGGRTLTNKGAKVLANKKPLVASKTLATTIFYRPHKFGVVVGTPMEYAATQQFGARQGAFGRTRRGGPIPWGNIPARPFMGISREDRATALDILRDYLTRP